MLTYLVASFVGFLHQHPPLVIQLHGHAAAAVGMFAHPAKKLLELPPQGGVGVGVGLGVAGARHQTFCSGKTFRRLSLGNLCWSSFSAHPSSKVNNKKQILL